MGVYNENRDKNNSMHDEIREQNAKLKDAPFSEKLSYFKDYYLKSTLAILAGLILVGSIIYTMVTAPKETAFGAMFFNSSGDPSNHALLDEFVARRGIDTKKSDAFIDPTYTYSVNHTSYDYESEYIGLQKSMALISSKDVDIIAGDKDAFDYYCRSECFADVTNVLPADIMEEFKDKIYYFTNEETGAKTPLGIYVTDAPKLNDNLYFIGREPIMGFVINSEHPDTAIDFLRFIYNQ